MIHSKFKIFDNLIEGVQVVDPNFRYVYLNKSAAIHAKQKVDELIGYSMMEKYPGIENTITFELISKCLNDQHEEFLINEFNFPDGSKGYFELRVQPIEEGAIIFSHDVTDQKKAEEIIKSKNEVLEAEIAQRTQEIRHHVNIINSAMDAIISIDENQEIMLFNKAASDMFGYSYEEIIGKHLEILLPERFRSNHVKLTEKFKSTSQTSRKMGDLNQIFGLRKNGEEFPIEATISRSETSEKIQLSVILRDVTNRVKQETELRNALELNKTMFRELHHRIKNNLQMISSILFMKSSMSRDDKLNDFIKETQNRIFSIAKIHDYLLRQEKTDMLGTQDYFEGLISNLINSLSTNPSAYPVNKEIEDHVINIDLIVKIGLLINEIVSNVLKHAYSTDVGGPIDFVFVKNGSHFILEIADKGIGFSAESGGSLGLTLVQLITRELNSSLIIDNQQGTKYRIEIPIA
ncbi:MAG: PAS domain S-box protein [Bacteroidota bacterium]